MMGETLDAGRARAMFGAALAGVPRDRPVLLVGHFDVDGLAAIAVLARALERAGRAATVRVLGKGETPWDPDVAASFAASEPALIVIADLGVRAEPIVAGFPVVLIDHHVPAGWPADAIVVSGNGTVPEPTTALIAWWCAGAIAPVDDLVWLAGLGLIGDMADKTAGEGAYPELAEAGRRFGKTALRDAVSLLNAPRRAAAADAAPALRLLMSADGPKAILSGVDPDTALLHAAKAEVKIALDAAKRVAPRIGREVALIRFSSPCQIHPLIAQQWRGRLRDKIVLAANTGYRDGWVHFAARSATGVDLIRFLADHRPPGADSRYGSGHAQATGGALRPADWNAFVTGLGFPDEQVPL